MRKYILTCLLVIFNLSLSFGQTWLWGRQETCPDSSGGAEGYTVTVDRKGDPIMFCFTTPGKCSFGTDTVSSIYGALCLVKYDPSGKVLWVNQTNPVSSTAGLGYTGSGIPGLSTDNLDNVYFTGVFLDTAVFGSTKLIDKSAQSCFIAKYDFKGNIKWVRQTIQPSKVCVAWINSIVPDNIGSVYCCGAFHDTCTIGTTTMKSQGYTETFIAKYDTSGNFKWVMQTTGDLYGGGGEGVGTDAKGNVYMAGAFSDTTSFGSHKLKSKELDAFLVKYDSTGKVKWAVQSRIASTSSQINPAGIQVDRNGNSYVAGNFIDTVIFAKDTLISHNTWPVGDLYLVKYDSSGKLVWAIQSNVLDENPWQIGGMALDTTNHLSISAFGGGGLNGCLVKFGSSTISGTYKDTIIDGLSFIVEFDTSGKYLCGTSVGGGGDDQNGIGVDPSGNYFYFSGDLGDTITFGSNKIGPKNGTAETPFIARWQPCGVITGINQLSEYTKGVEAFPNPSHGKFTFRMPDNNQSKAVTRIEIYNVIGEQVYSKFGISDSQFLIDIGNCSSGIYFYRLTDENGKLISSGKLIMK